MISEHITLEEATRTGTGFRNVPDGRALLSMKAVAQNVFEQVRAGLGGHPIKNTSFYRSPLVNKKVGGSITSQHVKGEAMDLQAIHGTNKEIFDYIRKHLIYDQLIWEFGNDIEPDWVHVSYAKKNRKQCLRSKRFNGKTWYENI